jgi:hypothetical protein
MVVVMDIPSPIMICKLTQPNYSERKLTLDNNDNLSIYFLLLEVC